MLRQQKDLVGRLRKWQFLLTFSTAFMLTRVTSLEQLSVAEFSGEQASPKVYENGHKNVLAIWFDLVSNVKLWAHF